MARHTITVEELTAYLDTESWHIAASSAGNGARKMLETSNKGLFRVTDHREVKYIGNDRAAAVAAYNAAR